ncbi:NADH-quinone oxidoreductase subunit M [Paenibacillus sambharensis]|uniref:NADH-quinone oxidoreductase subunit M n=1 Tax=Paenibacillus sambharensis TaxID=1803190 RepID=A0A2W1LS50_9BACL|nr:NADH-quinone oxidoreductase subunit M [Paenibacillus sambharensis]PZD97802.1 NADH-quinone oxidoreductase subunit M [Paenibacillus sambharensis]
MPETIPWLTFLVFAPLLGVVVLLLVPRRQTRLLRLIAVAAALLPLALSLWLFGQYDAAVPDQFREQAAWMNVALNREALSGSVTSFIYQFQYDLALDGISLPLVLLAAFIGCMAALASVNIRKRRKSYYVWFLLLETGMLGVFLARDLLLFFLFFELTLVAMFFLIAIWGYFDREKAANTFLIYNGLGSAVMLFAFILLIYTAGFQAVEAAGSVELIYSGSYDAIAANLLNPEAYVNLAPNLMDGDNPFYMSGEMRWTVFILLLVAFGIKLPIVPLHTWMLHVHKEAPVPVVMIHSGVLLKMGAYGLLRFGMFLFPAEAREAAAVIAWLGLASILYGALLALRQHDFKLVLAYSSLSHMGIVLLGLASFNEIGIQGAVFQLVSHGLISALLFLIAGSIQERTGTTELAELGGLARSVPFISGVLLAGGLASLGLPGLSGFVGEFLSFLGLFESMKVVTVLAAAGMVITAAYVLRSVLGITFGPLRESGEELRDARLIEAVPMIALLAFIILLGLYPSVLTGTTADSLQAFLSQLRVGG